MAPASVHTTVLALALAGPSFFLAAPAAAQYYRPGDDLPPRVYVPGPPAGYQMLPPWEVRNLLRRMGYSRVAPPHLSGRIYAVSAVDDEGPVILRVDAYTGRVLDARVIGGRGPTIVMPAEPPPRGVPSAPSSKPHVASRTSPSAPLPRPRPAQASGPSQTAAAVPGPVPADAAATPAPEVAAVPKPAASAPAAPPVAAANAGAEKPAPGASPSGAVATQAVASANPAAPAPAAAPSQPSASKTPQSANSAAQGAASPAPVTPATVAAPAAKPATVAAPAAKPAQPVQAQSKGTGTGAGSATPGGSSAGSASVLSRAAAHTPADSGAPN